MLANVRYWSSVAPTARRQLRRWERRAQAIPDPYLRGVALERLRGESFNAEGATTLATLAGAGERRRAAEAIVALQVMYDYIDGLAEQTPAGSPQHDRRLFQALTDAVTPPTELRDYYRDRAQREDGGYLAELTATVRDTLARLPASAAIAPVAERAARRCAEAQIRIHARSDACSAELRAWAEREAAGTRLDWRVFLAGAVTSALSVYALIAAGADARTTREQAVAIDAAYLSIAAVATMLDTVVDSEHDLRMGTQWYLRCYQDPAALADDLSMTARRAVAQARALPHGGHHVTTLVGVAAYYLSTREASGAPAKRVTAGLRRELRPLLTPTLALMRAWRAARRAHDALSRMRAGRGR